MEIRVRDNGNGIPRKVLGQNLSTIFTIKPTGRGTGLGLSLGFDIIIKNMAVQYGRKLKEGEFRVFMIQLPNEL